VFWGLVPRGGGGGGVGGRAGGGGGLGWLGILSRGGRSCLGRKGGLLEEQGGSGDQGKKRGRG